jgi:hypothetical protein
MDHQPRVQVVLGEAERTDGLLRFVLEGEGFDIIGLAADDRELARVLRGARPAVIVLDGGISATAALEARRSSPGASLVVVWPDGVSAAVAEEHVEPDLVISDLGDAVRRASRRAELRKPPDPMPELLRRATTDRPVPAAVRKAPVRITPSRPARTGRRGSGLLVAAATWLLVITALGTIAIAVPKAFDRSPSERAPRSSPSRTVDPRPSEKSEAPERTEGTREPATCQACAPDRGRVTTRTKGAVLVDEAIPPSESSTAGANEATTVPPLVTDSVQLEDVLDSLPIGDPPPGIVPTPGADVIPISTSSAANLSTMPWNPLP